MLKLWKYIRTQIIGYLLKFGVVGLLSLVVDIVIFNALLVTVPNNFPFFGSPIGAKIISTIIATIVAWLGNRFWTFRNRRRQDFWLELIEFSAVAAGGMGISLICLWISHYWLGYTSLLADNIATNFVGFALATAFRFALYRYWVFGSHRKAGLKAPKELSAIAAEMAVFENETDATIETSEIAHNIDDSFKRKEL